MSQSALSWSNHLTVNIPREILVTLLFDLDIKQKQRMEPQTSVLFEPIVERVRFPGFGKENERNCLPEVIEL